MRNVKWHLLLCLQQLPLALLTAHLVQYVREVTEEATIDPLEGMIIVTVTVTEVMKGMGHQDTSKSHFGLCRNDSI